MDKRILKLWPRQALVSGLYGTAAANGAVYELAQAHPIRGYLCAALAVFGLVRFICALVAHFRRQDPSPCESGWYAVALVELLLGLIITGVAICYVHIPIMVMNLVIATVFLFFDEIFADSPAADDAAHGES